MLHIITFLIWVSVMIKSLRYVSYKELYKAIEYSTTLSKKDSEKFFISWLKERGLR